MDCPIDVVHRRDVLRRGDIDLHPGQVAHVHARGLQHLAHMGEGLLDLLREGRRQTAVAVAAILGGDIQRLARQHAVAGDRAGACGPSTLITL